MKNSIFYKNIKIDFQTGCIVTKHKTNYGHLDPISGYLKLTLVSKGGGKNCSVLVHRLIWSEFHEKKIPKGLCICHKNDNRKDNRISNLLLETYSFNNKSASKNKNYKEIMKHIRNSVPITAHCLENGEKIDFDSIYKASKKLLINSGLISMILSQNPTRKYFKNARSKLNKKLYTFKNQLITDYIS